MKYCDHQRNKRNWTQPKYNKHKKSMKYEFEFVEKNIDI